MDLNQVIGRWPGILRELGVDDSFLQNRHGPCPFCGGKDRFRFDDKDGRGTYYCSQCGSGDGWNFACNHTMKDFAAVAKDVEGIVGSVPMSTTPVSSTPRNRLISIEKILSKCVSAGGQVGHVSRYLFSRGLAPVSRIGEHYGLPYWEGKQCLGSYPAMICKMITPDGKLSALHRTYLSDGQKADVPSPKKFTPSIRPMPGSAIRLSEIVPTIGIAEGVETALAVTVLHGTPCWASGTSGMLEAFIPPLGVETVRIFADHDRNFVGQAAGYILAKRLYSEGYGVTVEVCQDVGDYADKVGLI